MKPIHPRIYAALPRPVAPVAASSASSRVRSNSASRSLYTGSLPFFDSPPPPPPSSRPSNPNLVVSRLAAEVKAELEGHTESPYSQEIGHAQSQTHGTGPPPYSLALTSGQSEFSHSPPHIKPLFPYSSFPPAFAYAPAHSADIRSEPAAKRQRTRYHLDVGAYGIPKRSHGASIAGRDGNGRFAFEDAFPPSDRTGSLGRAVQVGEDAYFVRDNAMGVADGVGGWSKHRRTGHAEPSPSALFARRLMHYCSEGVEAATTADSHPPSDAPESELAALSIDSDSADLMAELEDSLEDLEDGLDVLMILEKAFQKTMEDHVGEAPHTPTEKASDATADSSPRSTSKADDAQASSPTSSPSPARQARSPSPKRPLVEGSSTALVAVLEHPRTRAKQARPLQLFGPSPRPSSQGPAVSERGAMLTIAHLGDCMGMLIRGEDIVWRTEEMWWNFNTPVQLGPASPTRPRDAQVFRIPVQADDILILASDGLSDNLWDEDVLDEVIRFRRPFLADGSWSTPAPAQGVLGRSTLAAMLSEALCSRARRAAERREGKGVCDPELEVPFARRARELGRSFHGGKPDDISVLVAVVSPAEAKRP
ncbi:phosphatase 2C-like domain-containing protein [Rhodofomes roseus]|uniref:Protein phosphatase n=1 Tax=Rhodofomes roseus TaxID=34475 RepID=A0ABQ8KQ31_9APHY|nr:phosphatase 2C-like domain-containing protein [Rhodofomes roseus]KAH9840726.1 phosphatase 2C-like domain-containing protein [Rhodofomes roseus]